MGVKLFIAQHWKWFAIAAGVLVLVAVISGALSSIYGAGVGVVAWYATRQHNHLRAQHEAAVTVADEVETTLQDELVRQQDADTQLNLKVTAVRRVNTGDIWDTTEVMDRPKLDD